jgi:hypothetical protein
MGEGKAMRPARIALFAAAATLFVMPAMSAPPSKTAGTMGNCHVLVTGPSRIAFDGPCSLLRQAEGKASLRSKAKGFPAEKSIDFAPAYDDSDRIVRDMAGKPAFYGTLGANGPEQTDILGEFIKSIDTPTHACWTTAKLADPSNPIDASSTICFMAK